MFTIDRNRCSPWTVPDVHPAVPDVHDAAKQVFTMRRSGRSRWAETRIPTAQTNEVLAKVLCHNLACIVHAITEFGIDADCAKPSLAAVQP